MEVLHTTPPNNSCYYLHPWEGWIKFYIPVDLNPDYNATTCFQKDGSTYVKKSLVDVNEIFTGKIISRGEGPDFAAYEFFSEFTENVRLTTMSQPIKLNWMIRIKLLFHGKCSREVSQVWNTYLKSGCIEAMRTRMFNINKNVWLRFIVFFK